MASMDTPDDALSYMTPIGYTNSSSCGYCGRRGKSFSYYASSASMSAGFYQTLLDRYWRRSGNLFYRPNQRQACCPHYTIRLDSTQFKPSKDQRQAVNRFNKHITGPEYTKAAARLYPKSREEAKKRETQFDLVERLHEVEVDQLKSPPEPSHRFVVTLENDDFTEEKYSVYENYQRIVHKNAPSEISRQGFTRFLCDSPVRRETRIGPDGKEQRLGSFHQCYWMDGRLVAVGVLDLLPHCVSAVYFLYHESIHQFTPGKLGALREIALAREAGYRYWYPGFYIHSCPKMRYKIDYLPPEILDPETLDWKLLDERILKLLDVKPYASFSTEGRSESQMSINGDDRDAPAAAAADESDEAMDDGDSDDSEDASAVAVLFEGGMPGIPPMEEILSVDMDHIALRIDSSGTKYRTSDLVVWGSQSGAADGFKLKIAELVAAIGPDLIESLCLDFDK